MLDRRAQTFKFQNPPLSLLGPSCWRQKDTCSILMHIPTQDQWRLSETQELWLKFSILSRDHPAQSKIKLKLGYSLSPSVSVKSLPKGSDDHHMIQESSALPDPGIPKAVPTYLHSTRLKHLGAVMVTKMQRHCCLFTHQLKNSVPFFKKYLKMKCLRSTTLWLS